MRTDTIAIVPAAGLGKRFDAHRKKTFADLDGAPLVIRTLKRLHDEEAINEIIPVFGRQDIEKGFKMVKDYKLTKVTRIATGGAERQDSIYNALKLINETRTGQNNELLVLIHDGVRPFIPRDLINRLIDGAKGVDGVVPGIPVKDTLKEVNGNGIVVATVDREKIRAIQTPQVFSYPVIRNAYEKAEKEGFYATDDAGLVERAGGKVRIIDGSPYNIKVTTPEDLEMLEYIFSKEHTT